MKIIIKIIYLWFIIQKIKIKKKKIENQNNKKKGDLNLKVVENSLKFKII